MPLVFCCRFSLLHHLHQALPGLSGAQPSQPLHGQPLGAALSYMEDVGEDEKDILIVDKICCAFEAAFWAILNRNRKTVILGFSTLVGHRDWPLPWL
jgi:hypothetical protein